MTLNPFRLYMDVVDDHGIWRSEGPYPFATAGDALDYARTQTHVDVRGLTLYEGTELVAQVGGRP